MRFAKLAVAAILIGIFELAFGWRLAVGGVLPDLLFVFACAAAAGPRPGEGVPVACGIGLVADFLLGGRLGLMALGYGLGTKVMDGVRPVLGRALSPGPEGGAGRRIARAGEVFLLVLAGAGAAHGTVAILGAVLGAGPGGAGARIARAAGVAFLTALVSPLVWPVMELVLGTFSGHRGPRRRNGFHHQGTKVTKKDEGLIL